MNGYGLAVWSSLLLAELLVVVVVLHVFWLRRRWQRKANHLSKTLTPFLPEIAAKAKAIKDGYRHLIDETASDTSTLLEMISTYERELEELLLSGLDGTAHGYHTPNTDPLQPLWNDMREGHALLNTMTNALFGKTQLLQNLMERMKTQEQLLHELTELSTTYQKKLREFIKEPIEQQSIPDILEKLTQHYQILQDKLDELSVSNHDLFMKDSQYRTFSEQYRNFFETLQILKLENLRLAEKLRIQEPKIGMVTS
jgi:hypothetical protein